MAFLTGAVRSLPLLASVVFAGNASINALHPIAPSNDHRADYSISNPLQNNGCPQNCQVTGPDPSNWTHIHSQNDLFGCELPLLFDFNIQNDQAGHITIRTCTTAESSQVQARDSADSPSSTSSEDLESSVSRTSTSSSCGAPEYAASLTIKEGPQGQLASPGDAAAAAKLLATYFTDDAQCGGTTLFAKSDSTVVGFYAGADVAKSSFSDIASHFAVIAAQGAEALQSCTSNTTFSENFAVYASDSQSQLADLQSPLQRLAGGQCPDIDGASSAGTFDIKVLSSDRTGSNSTQSFRRRNLMPRGDCRTIQVQSGDGCGSLASRCGISGNDFTKYNPKENLCSTLAVNQYVCCSAGDLPDMRPKPASDGTCATYSIVANDNCYDIGQSFGLTSQNIEGFNKKTWAWGGCGALQIGQVICLSSGNTPMPASVSGVTCGPQVPGTQKHSGTFNGDDLAKLNPCPLNACCDGFGFCGTTEEFCTESPSDTGAPGSMKPGTNGCISNCGTDIVNNGAAPDTFRKVVYFEAFNVNRDCLTMDATEIPTDAGFTHVHFAFAGLTSDFGITFEDGVQDQFTRFKDMDAPWKKILSFGGWAQSTDAGTFQLYRDAVKSGNREQFANNVVSFINDNGMDGVDFDWEYPGATDIPGVPAGTKDQGSDYLEFLKIIYPKLNGKSLSIALPASFWYLRPFPVDKMADNLDYFIYMTYDLHGQWDYGNKFSSPGCPNGNCLRSHVNVTETTNALSMITKAGVPAAKVVVGVASYARSFGMTDSSCTGPMCTFGGSFTESTAEPGTCTNTGGYISNAELNVISDSADAGLSGYVVKKWYDAGADSNIMTYGSQGEMTSWAAYMDDTTKNSRISWVKGLNFGGTTDWAIDLEQFYDGPDGGDDDDDGSSWDDLPDLTCDSTNWPDNLDDLDTKIDSIPGVCLGQAVLYVLQHQLGSAVADYQDASMDYDDKFEWYVDAVKDSVDDSLEKFMQTTGIKYMDCNWESRKTKGSGPCTDVNLMTGDLPPNQQGGRKIEYILPIRDEKGFYDALLADYGIEKDWIYFKDRQIYVDPCTCPQPGQCSQCSGTNYMEYDNYPRRLTDASKIEVSNPKELVDKSIPNLDDLAAAMLDSYAQMRLGTMEANDTDVATSFSMPIFMLQDAADQIRKIKEIGEKQKENHIKELVLGILSIVFAIIPFVGEAAAAFGGAAIIARAALVIGEAGNIGLSIVDIVNDPTSAPFAILGIIGSLGAIKAAGGAGKAFGEAAGARRALGDDKLKLFSDRFQKQDALVQKILKRCG